MNFMWLLDSPIGIAAMTKNSFLHNLLEDINIDSAMVTQKGTLNCDCRCLLF